MSDEEEKKPEDNIKDPPYYFEDQNIYPIYATEWPVIVGLSEVTLYFGRGAQVLTTEGKKTKLDVAVTLSHRNFMTMMRHLSTRFMFLEKVYKGHPMGLPDLQALDPVEFKKALDEMITPPISDTNTENEKRSGDGA
jgi:hypothetical protein